jgi:hypothetical protein
MRALRCLSGSFFVGCCVFVSRFLGLGVYECEEWRGVLVLSNSLRFWSSLVFERCKQGGKGTC